MNVSKWIAGALIGVVAATFALDADAQRRLSRRKCSSARPPRRSSKRRRRQHSNLARPPRPRQPPAPPRPVRHEPQARCVTC